MFRIQKEYRKNVYSYVQNIHSYIQKEKKKKIQKECFDQNPESVVMTTIREIRPKAIDPAEAR